MGMQTWRNIDDVSNMFDLADVGEMASHAMQSQYAHAKAMRSLIRDMRRIAATRDMATFYENVFNLETATGVSLDVWARIVGIKGRAYEPESGEVQDWSEDDFKLLVKYKALSNISAGDAATINRLMTQFFDNFTFVIDNQDMTIRVVFLWYLSDLEANLISNYGLFVRGAGVGANYYQIDPDATFGFDGSGLQPFNQAPFLAKSLGTI